VSFWAITRGGLGHGDPKPKAFMLFDIAPPKSGVYFPELARLSRKLNTAFQKDAWPALNRRRKEYGLKSLEVTLALVKGRLYITYARSVRK
jgi:hypothetical protein